MTTKLILTHEVSGLGAAGDVVEVKDGYARNYLQPRGLATPWTNGGQRQLDQIRAARGKRSITNLEDAQALKATLESKPVVVSERAGEKPREIKAGQAEYLPPNIVHRGINNGPEPVKLVAVRIKPKNKPITEEVPAP